MRALAAVSAALALAFPAGAGAAESINLGAEVQPSRSRGHTLADTVRAPCAGCLTLAGTITGPADAIAFRAASSPYSLSYDYLLNDPCQRNPQTWEGVPCPTPLYSGPVTVYLASWWFLPATWTFYVWAERPVASCHPHGSTEAVPRPAEPQDCQQTRCSRSQLVRLPATVLVGCGGLAVRTTQQRR